MKMHKNIQMIFQASELQLFWLVWNEPVRRKSESDDLLWLIMAKFY